MTPAPAVGLLWALIDIALCHFSVLHPIYYLVESTLLTALNLILGSMSIGLYRCARHNLRDIDPHANARRQLGLFRLLGSWHLHSARRCHVSACD